jgi:hypothetical protein
MLLLSLAGCVQPDAATLPIDPDAFLLLKQDRAQCMAQCRAEAQDAACTVDDSTSGPSCPRLACHVHCPPVTPPGQQTPRPDQDHPL